MDTVLPVVGTGKPPSEDASCVPLLCGGALDDVLQHNVLPRLPYRDFAAFALAHPRTLRVALGCDPMLLRNQTPEYLPRLPAGLAPAETLQRSRPGLEAGWRLAAGQPPRTSRWTVPFYVHSSDSGKFWLTYKSAHEPAKSYEIWALDRPCASLVGRPRPRLRPCSSRHIVWSPCDARIAFFGARGIELYEVATRKTSRAHPPNAAAQSRVHACAWSPEGRRLLAATGQGLTLFAVAGKQPMSLWSLDLDSMTTDMCWLSHTDAFVRGIGLGDGATEVRSARTGDVLCTLAQTRSGPLIDPRSDRALLPTPLRLVDLPSGSERLLTDVAAPLGHRPFWIQDGGSYWCWRRESVLYLACVADGKVARVAVPHAPPIDWQQGSCVAWLKHGRLLTCDVKDPASKREVLAGRAFSALALHPHRSIVAVVDAHPATGGPPEVLMVDLDEERTLVRETLLDLPFDRAPTLEWAYDGSFMTIAWHEMDETLGYTLRF